MMILSAWAGQPRDLIFTFPNKWVLGFYEAPLILIRHGSLIDKSFQTRLRERFIVVVDGYPHLRRNGVFE